MNYRIALRAKGLRSLPSTWQGRTDHLKRPGHKVLERNDRQAITIRG